MSLDAGATLSNLNPTQATGNINMTRVFNQQTGPFPISGSFTSGTGTIIASFSGTYEPNGSGLAYITFQVDSTTVYTFVMYINQPNVIVPACTNFTFSTTAGTHTFTISVTNSNWVTSSSDRYNLTLIELPV